MTKQEFITEFTLRALTQIEVLEASDEAYYIRTSIRIANDTWAAIQAANKPLEDNSPEFDSENLVAQSEKIIKEAMDVLARIPPSVPNLKALAQKAVQVSHGAAKYLTIDADGKVIAFDSRPSIDQYSKDRWVTLDPYNDLVWLIGDVPPPVDFTQECYRVSEILAS